MNTSTNSSPVLDPATGCPLYQWRGLSLAMPSARAATPSGPSLLRVSGIAGIAIAVFALVYFGLQLIRGWVS